MLNNYLRVALRSLQRQKGYAALNVVGLALGLACCLLLFQYVAHERSVDAFHANADDLYRVTLTTSGPYGPQTSVPNGYALAPTLADAVPEVARTARLHHVWKAVVSTPERPERAVEVDEAFWADAAFLSLFSFPLTSGDAATALAQPGSVVLTAEAAAVHFGTDDPMGRTLSVLAFGQRTEARVTGVLAEAPGPSHLRFTMLLPMADLLQNPQYAEGDGWGFSNFHTYVQLREGASAEASSAAASAAFERARGDALREAGVEAELGLQPLRDVYLNEAVQAPNVQAGSYRTVSFFALLGLATLLIALVNYVNLATARAARRSREVGVRKAIGARRGQLVTQFLIESALTNVLALLLALVLATAFRPTLSAVIGVELSSALWASPWLWGGFALTFAAGTLLAGLYPAFVLSSFRPALALKGAAGGSGGHVGLRRGLVVVQFAASVAMVAGVLVVSMQVRHMRALDLGVVTEQVVTVPAPRIRPDGADRAADVETLKRALAEIPSVRAVAASQTVPGQGHNMGTTGIRLAGSERSIAGSITDVDTDFAALYGLRLVAGADLPQQPLADAPVPVLANESMVAALGFGSATEAVGAGVDLSGRDAEIVGVVADAHWSSAHQAQEAAFLALNPAGHQVSIQINAGGLPRSLEAIEAAYTDLFPGNPFRYEFVDALVEARYRDDQRFATLFSLFAGLAIVIACLGLVGLAAFSAQQRAREIGVRKVLGASAASIVGLLSGDFVRLVLAGAVLALPLAWWAMRGWLEGYAYRVDLGPAPFAAAVALALAAAMTAVLGQSLRAATSDPVRALRSE